MTNRPFPIVPAEPEGLCQSLLATTQGGSGTAETLNCAELCASALRCIVVEERDAVVTRVRPENTSGGWLAFALPPGSVILMQLFLWSRRTTIRS